MDVFVLVHNSHLYVCLHVDPLLGEGSCSLNSM